MLEAEVSDLLERCAGLTKHLEHRAMSREAAERLIQGALWAFSTEEGSTASAYAYMAIMEDALGLEDWTFRE